MGRRTTRRNIERRRWQAQQRAGVSLSWWRTPQWDRIFGCAAGATFGPLGRVPLRSTGRRLASFRDGRSIFPRRCVWCQRWIACDPSLYCGRALRFTRAVTPRGPPVHKLATTVFRRVTSVNYCDLSIQATCAERMGPKSTHPLDRSHIYRLRRPLKVTKPRPINPIPLRMSGAMACTPVCGRMAPAGSDDSCRSSKSRTESEPSPRPISSSNTSSSSLSGLHGWMPGMLMSASQTGGGGGTHGWIPGVLMSPSQTGGGGGGVVDEHPVWAGFVLPTPLFPSHS